MVPRSRLSRLIGLSLFAVVTLAAGSATFADTYKADPAHSTVLFRAKHMDTSWVYGRFGKFEATITYDESDPSKFAAEGTIQVDSIDTGVGKRDAHLKSPDFFSAKEFPTITFKSMSAKKSGDNSYDVTGDLTMHGQTKPITLTIEKVGNSTSPQMGTRVGWISTFTVKRSDFGMNFMNGPVSDDITLTVALETAKG